MPAARSEKEVVPVGRAEGVLVAQVAASPLRHGPDASPSSSNTPSPSLHYEKLSSPPTYTSYPTSPTKSDGDADCPTPSTFVGEEPLKSPGLLRLPSVLSSAGPPARPYSAFSNKMKWIIALLCGAGAIISPLSSNIFVPAIPSMADAFGHSEEHIALGVTVYLVFQ